MPEAVSFGSIESIEVLRQTCDSFSAPLLVFEIAGGRVQELSSIIAIFFETLTSRLFSRLMNDLRPSI